MIFQTVRQKELKFWLTKTNRKFKIGDSFEESFECHWQLEADKRGKNHISIFCSLGDFATNLTDLLRDKRCDKYKFGLEEERDKALFRYYTRIFLIASELL